MHVAVFIVVNLVVAIAIGVMAFADGHGAGGIAWRMIATLVALQAAYALWIVALAWIAPRATEDRERAETADDGKAGGGKMASPPRDHVR